MPTRSQTSQCLVNLRHQQPNLARYCQIKCYGSYSRNKENICIQTKPDDVVALLIEQEAKSADTIHFILLVKRGVSVDDLTFVSIKLIFPAAPFRTLVSPLIQPTSVSMTVREFVDIHFPQSRCTVEQMNNNSFITIRILKPPSAKMQYLKTCKPPFEPITKS